MASGQGQPHSPHSRESRVHFPDEQVQRHDSKIVLERGSSDSELHVNLGFLQLNHRYEVQFAVEDTLGDGVTWDSSKATCAVVLQANPLSGAEGRQGHALLLNFQSSKEKLIAEEIILVNSTGNRKLTLILHARILGKDKGTPVLREGIHCVEKDDSNNVSGQKSEFVRSNSVKLE